MTATSTDVRRAGKRRVPTTTGVWLAMRGSLTTLLVVIVVWELLARSGRFSPSLLPDVARVSRTFLDLLTSGVLLENTAITMGRMLFGYGVAIMLGITLGFSMAHWKIPEELGLPVVSFLLPIPSLALVPLFTIWFGLGGLPTIMLVIFVATPPIILNTWSGTKNVDEVLVRAASSMGVSGLRMFARVIFPAALPFILAGLRFGLSVAWRAVIAGELISATDSGLGFMLFDARNWMRPDVMFATLIVIAVLGMVIEKAVFAAIDRATVMRWGMVSPAGRQPGA
jgi:NitT/TauT family transport system permease protein